MISDRYWTMATKRGTRQSGTSGFVPVREAGQLADGRSWHAMKLICRTRLDVFLDRTPELGERLRVRFIGRGAGNSGTG
jgi:hypothetical protein